MMFYQFYRRSTSPIRSTQMVFSAGPECLAVVAYVPPEKTKDLSCEDRANEATQRFLGKTF